MLVCTVKDALQVFGFGLGCGIFLTITFAIWFGSSKKS